MGALRWVGTGLVLAAVAACVDLRRPGGLTTPPDPLDGGGVLDAPSGPRADGGHGIPPDAAALDAPPGGDAPGAPEAREAPGPLAPEVASTPDTAPAADAPAAGEDAARDLPLDTRPTPDAPGAPETGAPPGCLARYPGALFCEDFEAGLPTGDPTYYPIADNGTVTITSQPVFRGGRALRAFVTRDPSGGPSRAHLVRRLARPLTEGALHVRAHLYVRGGFAVQGWFVLLNALGAGEKISFDLVAGDRVHLAMTTAGMFLQGPPGGIPRDRWFCAEVAIQIAPPGGGGFAEGLVDGRSQIRSPPGADTQPPSGFTQVSFGAEHVQGLTADGEVFVDEVVVSQTRIGCP